MKSSKTIGVTVALAAMLAACAGGQSQEAGSALVNVSGRSTSLTVGSVTLTISDYKSGAPQALTGVGGVFSGTFEDIPAGLHQICANAGADFDQSCTNVTITKNSMASVSLVIQQKSGTAGTINTNSPFISGISLSDGAPYYGETITMTATASDPSAIHALEFKWSAACSDSSFGSVVGDDTHQTATLTTSCHGTETITLQVTDKDQMISSVVSFPVVYSAQGANVSVTVNAWPNITSITTPDAQLNPGDRTTLTVVANDVEDGTNLTYSWTADCGASGIFNAPDMETTGFLAPNMTGDCKATVTVSDHGGGSTSGSIIIHIGAVSPTYVVYDAIPDVLPGNYPSLGFEAYSGRELGDFVTLAGTARHAVKATILLSNWAKHSEYPSMAADGFSFPITLNIYNASPLPLVTSSVPGALIGSVTQTVFVPWRPEPSGTVACGDTTRWLAGDGHCYNGSLSTVTIDLSAANITLPDSFIYGIVYNTLSAGPVPNHTPGPYNSLNIALPPNAPSVGSEVAPGTAFWNSTYAGFYGDNGAAGTGTFRADINDWVNQVPAVEFFAY